MGKYDDRGPFIEDKAIRAAQELDDEALKEILEEFSDGELRRLSRGAEHLVEAIHDEITTRVRT